MDPIHNVNQLINVLRRKLSPDKRRTGETDSNKTVTDANTLTAKPLSSLDTQSLQKRIGQKISTLDTSDPDYHQKASKVLVESVLIWRFGDDILQDPKFYTLEKEVRNALNLEGNVNSDMEKLFKQLNAKST